jgi:hypothetical protein
MHNKAMERKVLTGECLDISKHRNADEGVYVLPEFIDGKDYADCEREAWIWSIGRELATGKIVASTDTRYYQHPEFECLFLR